MALGGGYSRRIVANASSVSLIFVIVRYSSSSSPSDGFHRSLQKAAVARRLFISIKPCGRRSHFTTTLDHRQTADPEEASDHHHPRRCFRYSCDSRDRSSVDAVVFEVGDCAAGVDDFQTCHDFTSCSLSSKKFWLPSMVTKALPACPETLSARPVKVEHLLSGTVTVRIHGIVTNTLPLPVMVPVSRVKDVNLGGASQHPTEHLNALVSVLMILMSWPLDAASEVAEEFSRTSQVGELHRVGVG